MRDADLGLKNTIWFYVAAVDVVIIDQLTKFLARAHLIEGKAVPIIPGVLGWRLAHNTGAAFGMLPDWAPLFILIGLVAIFAIVRLRALRDASLCLSIGLGLLLGGALGNLIDRLAFPGQGVTDFIDLTVKLSGYQWPTFNFADVAIVAGAIIVLFRVYVIEKRQTDDEHVDNEERSQTEG